MNEVSIKVVTLDLNFILNHFWKPALWGKVWTIFEYNGYRVDFRITTISTTGGYVWYELKLYKDGETLYTSSYNTLYFSKETRNLIAEYNRLNGAVWDIFESYEKDVIKMKAAYKEAHDFTKKAEDEIEKKANDFLDELGIENKDVREAYVDRQVADFDVDYYSPILRAYRYTILHKELAAWSLFTRSERLAKRVDEFSKLNGFEIGKIRKEIKEHLESIEVGDFYDSIELDEIE